MDRGQLEPGRLGATELATAASTATRLPWRREERSAAAGYAGPQTAGITQLLIAAHGTESRDGREKLLARAAECPHKPPCVARCADEPVPAIVGPVDAVDAAPRIRVGTWNLEWAKQARVRPQQAEVIAAAAADV